jgi:hypothetical protein
LGIGPGRIELSDQLGETIRDPLPYDIVVHGAELVADSRLNLGIKAALLLYFFHELSTLPRGVKSL